MSCEAEKEAVRDASEKLEAAKQWLKDLTGSDDPADSHGSHPGPGSEAAEARKAVKQWKTTLLEAKHSLKKCLQDAGGG